MQTITLTDNASLSFTDPSHPTKLTLKLVQDSTGGWDPSWPSSVLWTGGSEPSWSTSAGAEDLAFFYFDGTNYYGHVFLNYS